MIRFVISTGHLYDDAVLLDSRAYSGQPEARNNPARVRERSMGPIPPGFYRIGTAYKHPTKGPVVMRLTPVAGTDVFGRSGFLIHGDSIKAPGTASHGCIITTRKAREHIATLAARGTATLQVVAE